MNCAPTTLSSFIEHLWTSVILSVAKNLLVRREILRYTQNDSQQGAMKLDKVLQRIVLVRASMPVQGKEIYQAQL